VDDVLVKGDYVSPLPVSLKDFGADCDKVTWITESEINNKGFRVQTSKDLYNWEELGFVQGNGSSNELNSYNFNVEGRGYKYYRLIQEDFDGAQEVFGPISSDCQGINAFYVQNNVVYCEGYVKVMDMSGKTMAEGKDRVEINHLASAIYVVTGKQGTFKFFKGHF